MKEYFLISLKNGNRKHTIGHDINLEDAVTKGRQKLNEANKGKKGLKWTQILIEKVTQTPGTCWLKKETGLRSW